MDFDEERQDPPAAQSKGAFTPPNGGVKAWSCVAGAFLLQFCSFGYINACGIFQYHYQEVLLKDHSSSSLAWITTLQVFLLFLFGPIVGQLIDVYGAQRITIPFSTFAIFAVCMLSLCTKYWQVILAQGVAFGIASSGLALPALVLANQWFSSKKGLATGLVSSGSSLGGVIYPFMIPRLISSVGFPAAVRWTALMQGILLIIANTLVSTPFEPKGWQKKQQSAGFKALKSWPWLAFTVGCFFVFWGLFSPFNYLPEMAAQSGIDLQLAQYTLAVVNAGSVVGRIVPGFLSDHIGQFNMSYMVSNLSGILILAFWIPMEYYPSPAGIFIFAFLYGFASGGIVSLAPPCVVELADRKVEELGAKLGGWSLTVAFGSLTGLPIAGAIKDHGGPGQGFVGLMIFSGAALLLGASLSGVTRVLRGGWSIFKKV
ncbi:monocarboxylate permease-like protein [Lepidopterella palustris CBS 459.81]|uniref:Monocarboxylate permease-like protein n=1 Tax=Lepidopterella palustris CBS 459.81 TaxID=1314670 RepID=A0A8E2E7F1_9PEZI|nr:monocarboxylate permease-like protein [Lepidopterella palustris CBS 459.81]